MIHLLENNAVLLQDKIRDIERRIKAEEPRLKDKNGRPNEYAVALTQLQTHYPVDSFKFDLGALLSFPEKSLGIRDEGAICAKTEVCVVRTIVSKCNP